VLKQAQTRSCLLETVSQGDTGKETTMCACVLKKAKAEGNEQHWSKTFVKLFIEGKMFDIGGADSNRQIKIKLEPHKRS
jgi:hypothetical protein